MFQIDLNQITTEELEMTLAQLDLATSVAEIVTPRRAEAISIFLNALAENAVQTEVK